MKALIVIAILIVITIITSGQNLILNPDFENANLPDCTHWYLGCDSIVPCGSSSFICNSIVSDSTLPSGAFCLKLDAGFPNVPFAATYITGQSGTKIYQLEYWKRTLSSLSWIGNASIGIVSQNKFTASKTITANVPAWTQYTLIDTLTTLASDTIAVSLSAGWADFCLCTAYFSSISLTVLLPTNTAEFHNAALQVYPNPLRENLNISLPNTRYSIQNISITSLSSKQILQTTQTEIPVSHLAKGLYFVRVEFTNGQRAVRKVVVQ